jgi:hypothetical protein
MTQVCYQSIQPWVHKTLIAMFSIVVFCDPISAAEGRHALIIGIGEYSQASNTPPLHGIPVDMVNARRMAKEMGVSDESIVELRNDLATKENIQSEFKKLADKVKAGDRVFIYHSGHGARYLQGNVCIEGLQTYTKGVFTVTDVLSEADIASYTIPISEKADKVLMVIDTCFSGGVINAKTRSLNSTLKIQPKTNLVHQQCDVGVNQVKPRSLLSELKRLGVYQENFVQIAAANNNEFSWDSKELGGLATHTLAQCLTGGAVDLNKSGAVSLDEVRACAQLKLNELMKPHENLGMLPSQIQIRGNRNLIPVAIQKPPIEVMEPVPVVQIPPSSSLEAPPQIQPELVNFPLELITQVPINETNTAVIAEPVVVAELSDPYTSTAVITLPQVQPDQFLPSVIVDAPLAITEPPPIPNIVPAPPTATALEAPVKPPSSKPDELAVASIATLNDIEQQRNPKRQLDVKLAKYELKIGKDILDLTVKSSHDGYVYIVLLGSDAKSFYILYPNGLDMDNRIKAGKALQLPKPDWQIKAAGPVGTNNILVMVSDTPRKLEKLTMATPTAAEPFTYELNNLGGRSALINFLTGPGVDGGSESFGAKLLTVKEVQ